MSRYSKCKGINLVHMKFEDTPLLLSSTKGTVVLAQNYAIPRYKLLHIHLVLWWDCQTVTTILEKFLRHM